MKFLVSGAELSNALSKVSKALSAKTTNPILEGIKLSCHGENLTLTATDTEITIEKTIPVFTYLEGETVVPGRFFTEFVKKLENEEEIEIYLDGDGILRITYGGNEFKIQTMNAEEYPLINKDIKEKFFTMKQKDFKDLINKTVFACSQTAHNASRVDGCFISLENNCISAVATDTGRIAINKKDVENSSGDFSIIVMPRTLNEMVRILDGDEDLFTVVVQQNVILCEVKGTVLISSLVEGRYIDYKNIINPRFGTEIVINRAAFLNSLERASIVATDYNKIVKFDISENYVNVVAKSEIGDVSENVPVKLNGKDLEIAFFFKYVTDAIKAIDDEEISVCFNSPIEPCVIRPLEGDGFMHLIVPVRKNV